MVAVGVLAEIAGVFAIQVKAGAMGGLFRHEISEGDLDHAQSSDWRHSAVRRATLTIRRRPILKSGRLPCWSWPLMVSKESPESSEKRSMVMTGTLAGTWGALFFSIVVSARFGSLWYVLDCVILSRVSQRVSPIVGTHVVSILRS